MSISFDLNSLIPASPMSSAYSLSDVIIYSLLVVFAISIISQLVAYLRADKRIKFYSKTLLAGVSQESFSSQKVDISDKAKCSKFGGLWREFEETLIELPTANGVEYKNTIDAEHFFNTKTLARGITESRLSASVPGFLTAIGVLGTFLGLQSGLSGLQLGADASIDELRNGIGVMISGAAVAFLTSVWGVFLSLVFNFLDKIADRRKRTKIILLQSKIDQIFPRITPEEQLLKIASDGEQSREALQGLAEKIGDELQKTMSTVSSDITSSLEEALNNIMAPAISQLVNQSTQSGNAALESLITRFMDGIGEQGAQQREALTKTTDQMNSSMSSFGDNLNSLVSSLEDNQNLAKERDDLVIKQMNDASQKMAGSVSSEISTLGKTVADSMSGILDATEQSTTAVQQKISEQLDTVTKTINDSMSHSQQQSIESIKVMTESIQSQVTDIKEAVATSVEKLTDSSLSAAQAVQASMTEQLDKVVKSENAHIDKMAEHSTLISSTANELLESVKNTVEENLGVAGHLIHQAEELQKAVKANVDSQMDMSGKMLDASNKIMVTSENMKGYGEQFERANTVLSRALKESAESTTELSVQNKETLRQATQLQQQLVSDYQRYRDVQSALEQTVGLADSTFGKMRQHQEEYAKLLKSNVDSLAEQMTSLLRQFASEAQDQTSDRLNHWNHQTAEYTTTMNGAIQALAGVVDEMEGKLQ